MDRYQSLKTDIADAERSFITEGLALWEIRDSRLYSKEYGSWIEFCAYTGIEERASHMLIKDACLCFQLSIGTDQIDQFIGTDQIDQFKTSDLSGLPNTQSHARELNRMKSFELKVQCWQNVLKQVQHGGKLTAVMIQQEALLLEPPENKKTSQPEFTPPDKMYIDRHQPKAYEKPNMKDVKNQGKGTTIWNDTDKLAPALGVNAFAMLSLLLIKARGNASLTISNGEMMKALAMKSSKTFRETQRKLAEWQIICFKDDGGMSEYEIRDIRWVLQGAGLLEEEKEPAPLSGDDKPADLPPPQADQTGKRPRRRQEKQ